MPGQEAQCASIPLIDQTGGPDANGRWLGVDSPAQDRVYILETMQVQESTILDLYRQFEEYYYPYFPIIALIRSLQVFYDRSPALFWAIALTSTRHHPKNNGLYTQLRHAFRSILSNLVITPINTLEDLQALLMVCQWPLEVETQTEDPSWMLIGLAINAAQHMGLDKAEDEQILHQHANGGPLELYNSVYRRKTWMQAFQISTQISTWQGLPPHISSPSCLRALAQFCEAEAGQSIAAMTEIQRQFARNTTTLSEALAPSAQVLLTQHMTQEMQALRSQRAKTWSPALELNLQGAMIYLLAHCLVLAEDQAHTSDTNHFITTMMQQGFDASLGLIKVFRQLGEDASPPLLSHPKQHFRLAFQACLFLLKYLDYNVAAPKASQDEARNAVMVVYTLFKQFHTRQEFQRAACTLEVLARYVVPGERRIKTIVKSRMGASLNYNAIWTAASLRGGEVEQESMVTGAAAQEGIETYFASDTFDLNAGFPWGFWDGTGLDDDVMGETYQLFPNLSMSTGIV